MARGRNVGWQRTVILAIIGTTAAITADKLGLVNYLAGLMGYS